MSTKILREILKFKMGKLNMRNVIERKKRILLARGMFERARKRRRMIESVLYGFLTGWRRTTQVATVLLLILL